MAHKILFDSSSIHLSSSIEEIVIEVDGAFVDVRLTSSSGSILLDERFYPFEGKVSLLSLSSLIEDDMRLSGLCFDSYTLSAFTVTEQANAHCVTLNVLFCDRFTLCSDPESFLSCNFLTTLSTRRVAPDSSLSFLLYAADEDSLEAAVDFTCIDEASGEIITGSMPLEMRSAISQRIYRIPLIVPKLNLDIAIFIKMPAAQLKLLSFTLRCGARALSCFIDRSLTASDAFFFRNCFNAPETAVFNCVTTVTTEIDRSLATVAGRSQLYDFSETKSYEVESEPLPTAEAEWLDQLITSRSVYRLSPDSLDDQDPLLPVLIDNATFEVSDSDESPNTIKLSWRFDSNRPLSRLPDDRGAFSSQFSYHFA